MRRELPKFIGTPVKRREDPALVTGAGKFVADLKLPGMLDVALVRSPYPHAAIRAIDKATAESMPGVQAVVVAEDLLPRLEKPLLVATGADGGTFEALEIPSRYPLASDRARFVGEAVAAVVAEDAFQAADAASALEVDYEPLDSVADPEAALGTGAPEIHPRTNQAFLWTLGDRGRVERAFAAAETTITLEACIQRLIPNAMEPRAVAAAPAVADANGDERLTVWSTTQIPHKLWAELALTLGMPKDEIRVIAPEVGGGFGAKANIYAEEILLGFLARELKRPLRWVASRSEDYLATVHGRDQRGILRLAADREGKILAADLDVLVDVGAYYSRVSAIVPSLTGMMITGVYDIPEVRARVRGAFTNKAPTEPYRGAGRPEATHLIERAMDRLARELGMDPADLRRSNYIPPERFPYHTATGLDYDSGDYGQALSQALKRVGYRALRKEQRARRNKGGRPLGIGVASYVEICGFGPWEAATVTVEADAKVTVLSGATPNGQGHQTSWAQIAAETLQVPMKDVTVKQGDTAIVREGIGTFGSRSAAVGGSAVLETAVTVRERAKRVAAHLLEAAAEDLTLTGGRFHVVGAPKPSFGWKELARFAHGDTVPPDLEATLSEASRFSPESETYPFGTHVAVVELDPETGEIHVLRFLTVDDCGRVINPMLVEGQVHGGIAQGLGQALWEEAVYDESANLLSGSLMDYALPKADLLPRYETHRTETPTPLNPLGVKGIGEAATIGSMPALVNAVVDALAPFGVHHVDTPLTPEKIWRLMHEKESR